MVYAITYDLNKPHQDYDKLYNAIKSLGDWCHPLQNLWFVECSLEVASVRKTVQDAIDGNDSVFVCKVTIWDSYMPKSANDWLRSRV